ncbi:unnamed protein product [Rotaria sp. Silwood2]|nr:unnamed protein product [Rotaria sp. Silwood2]CAF4120052.1 unnamed protein product [Rotaria sp. Silwood2]
MIFLLLFSSYLLFLYSKIVTITAITTTTVSICRENLKWNVKNPIIILGTNISNDDVEYSENDRRYLNTPNSLYLDEQEQILYVSNQNGAAIKQLYLKNLTFKNIITNHKDALMNPEGIFVSKKFQQIYVVEGWPHYRIRMWSTTKQLNIDNSKTVIKLNPFNNHMLSIWVDSKGSIYFVDRDNNRIIKALFNDDGTNKNLTVVAGGHGAGNKPNQLNFPNSMYLDETNQVMYISNMWENTIRKWKLGSNKGEVIIGKSGVEGNSSTLMNCPSSMTLDENNQQLYVVDACNKRIQMFCLKQSSSYPLVGKTIIQFSEDLSISSIALDKTNFNLYVATVTPSTVTKYELETVINNKNQAKLKKKTSIKDKKKTKKN